MGQDGSCSGRVRVVSQQQAPMQNKWHMVMCCSTDLSSGTLRFCVHTRCLRVHPVHTRTPHMHAGHRHMQTGCALQGTESPCTETTQHTRPKGACTHCAQGTQGSQCAHSGHSRHRFHGFRACGYTFTGSGPVACCLYPYDATPRPIYPSGVYHRKASGVYHRTPQWRVPPPRTHVDHPHRAADPTSAGPARALWHDSVPFCR